MTLVEVRRRLGGAAYSFERDGLQMDNGQHVFLRCCKAYRALLERLGSSAAGRAPGAPGDPGAGARPPARLLRRELAAGARCISRARSLRYPRLSLAAATRRRARGARAGAPRPRRPGARPGHASASGSPGHGQDQRGGRSAVGPDRAADAERAGRRGLAGAGRVRVPHRPARRAPTPATSASTSATLQEIIGDPARRALEPRRRRRCAWAGAPSASSAATAGYRLDGRAPARARRSLEAQAVIVALPHDRAGALLEPLLGAERRARPAPLESSPIVNLHVVYDRRVLDEPFAAGVGTPVQYLFDRSDAAGAPRRLSVSRRVAVGGRSGDGDERATSCASATCPRWRSCCRGRARRPSSASR